MSSSNPLDQQFNSWLEYERAEKAARECLSLPIYPELTDAQIQRVAQVIRDFFG